MTKPWLPAIIALGCLCCLVAADDDPEETRSQEPSRLIGKFSWTLASSHLKPGGRFIGGASAIQCLTLSRTNNFASEDELRAMLLAVLDLESRQMSDGTFAIEYGNETTLLGRLVGGYSQEHFGDRLSAGYQHWELREEVGETASDFVYGRWDHFSRAEWSLTGAYGFPAGGGESSGLVEFRMSDSWALPGTRGSAVLTPLVGVAYGVNWFGPVHDGTTLSVGIALRRRLNERIRLGLSWEDYRRLSGDPTRLPDRALISLAADFAL